MLHERLGVWSCWLCAMGVARGAMDFFFIQVFFYRTFTICGQQGREGPFLVPLYHFHPLRGHWRFGRAIARGGSPLRMAGGRARVGSLRFLGAGSWHLGCVPSVADAYLLVSCMYQQFFSGGGCHRPVGVVGGTAVVVWVYVSL